MDRHPGNLTRLMEAKGQCSCTGCSTKQGLERNSRADETCCFRCIQGILWCFCFAARCADLTDSPHTNIALPAVVAGLSLIVLTLVYMWRRHKGLFSEMTFCILLF